MLRSRKMRVAFLAGLGLVGLSVVIAPLVARRYIVQRVVPQLEQRLACRIQLSSLDVRWGRIEIGDLTIAQASTVAAATPSVPPPPPVVVPRVTLRYALAPLLLLRVVPTTLVLERPRVRLIRGANGQDNISALLARLRSSAATSDTQGQPRRRRLPETVQIVQGRLDLRDEELGSIESERYDAHCQLGADCHATLRNTHLKLEAGPAASAGEIGIDFRLAGGKLAALPAITVQAGELTFWKGFTLTGIQGGITPDTADRKRANIDLRGGYGGVDRVLWDAKGWVRPDEREGNVELGASRFDLAQLRPILSGTPIIDPDLAQVDARIRLAYHGDKHDVEHLEDTVDFNGTFHLSGLSVFHPMLGANPVRHLGFDAGVVASLNPKKRTLRITRAQFEYRGVTAELSAYAEKLGRRPAFDAWLKVAPVPCQTALQALPAELTPALQGFRLAGTFKSQLHVAIDLSDLEQGVALDGSVGIDGCRVLNAPEAVAAERLLGTFEHAVESLPGEWLTFAVGPENPDWVPLDEISPHLVNAIMTTEDSTFMRHHGFIPSEFRSALKSNLEHGYFHIGASSITMQMVKNVLLSREKTLARKLQELFLTWYVEHHLTKQRILEIYFNVVEFGPGLYGIGRAARHYFGKPAREIDPRQAVWFSSIMPNPKRRYVHFCRGAPDAKWEAYLDRILRRMHERSRLTDEEYQQALMERLTFNREEALPERECRSLIQRYLEAASGAGAPARDDADAEP